jgi:DNA-binding NarL/FixJ family response regulator
MRLVFKPVFAEHISTREFWKDMMMTDNYRVMVADDHAFIRKGLISILEKDSDFHVEGEANDGFELLNLLNIGVVPDVLILDLSMPALSGIEVLRRIRQMHFVFKVLVLTMHKEPDILKQALSAGANGYMLKDEMATELLPALHTLLENKPYLSPAISRELHSS